MRQGPLLWTLRHLTRGGRGGHLDPGWRLVDHRDRNQTRGRRTSTESSSYVHMTKIFNRVLHDQSTVKELLSCRAPKQQPCLGSFGESASSLSVASSLSTSRAVRGVTNWCSTASAMILWVIFLFLAAVGARDLQRATAQQSNSEQHKFAETSPPCSSKKINAS